MKSSLYQPLLITILGMLCFWQAKAERMFADNPYYDFASYIFERTYTETIDCEPSLINSSNIKWLCGQANVGEDAFKDLWQTYISVRPAGIPLSSLSVWGEITLKKDSSIEGRLYKTDDGYILVSYDAPPESGSSLGIVKVGYAKRLNYVVPSYTPTPLEVISSEEKKEETTKPAASDGNDTTPSEEDGNSSSDEGMGLEPEVITGEQFNASSDTIFGDRNAPIVIIEYSDYNCPFCSKFHNETLPLLLENHITNGKASFIYRDVTLIGGPVTESAINATECVKAQISIDDQLDFINSVYLAPRPRNAESIQNLAKDLKINQTDLTDCIQNQPDSIQAPIYNAHSNTVGVKGAPTFVIGRQKDGLFEGVLIPGAIPYNDFDAVLNELSQKLK